jgi:hypothetical protein
MEYLSSLLAKLKEIFRNILCENVRLDELKVNQGILLAQINENKRSTKLTDYAFKIFSQWGEDGIIQYLIRVVEIRYHTFIEFGVEDFTESNCRFLLMKDNWSGYVIDGSSKNIERLRNSYYFWKHDLVAINSFITRENINDLILESGFSEDIGILSIDLDGIDYYVFETIRSINPRILICEYNAVFGVTRKISVPYDPDFNRRRKHFSNLYYGASLSAITFIANRKGYSLVGINPAGSNAFFVRNDLVNERVEILSPGEAFLPSQFRESRDEAGNLTFLAGDERLKLIKGLPVMNVETGNIEPL